MRFTLTIRQRQGMYIFEYISLVPQFITAHERSSATIALRADETIGASRRLMAKRCEITVVVVVYCAIDGFILADAIFFIETLSQC